MLRTHAKGVLPPACAANNGVCFAGLVLSSVPRGTAALGVRSLSSVQAASPVVLASSPHPTSHIRLLKYSYPSPSAVSQYAKEYHKSRMDLQLMHHNFWVVNNDRFEKAKENFERQVLAKTGAPASATDFSKFYRTYLVENQRSHLEYNKRWWRANWMLLKPAIRAEIVPSARAVEIAETLSDCVAGARTLLLVLIGLDPQQARRKAQGVSVR
ncbi:hypothetical protein HDU84_002767 [Entophlyctis sp. JEL0112]|nr:hypothetical protein HDU84_002767 [Entophlyctis sp. JEL0112]